LWTTPERVMLEIKDDGAGFDISTIRMALGHGLANMHTRAQKMRGGIEITSEPGKGTSVLAWIPLDQDDDTSQP